jgi:hypothetical protein
MSGPITAIFTTSDPFTVLLSAAILRAAISVAGARAAAAELAGEHQRQRDAQTLLMDQATAASENAVQQQLNEAEQLFNHLLALADKIGLATQISASKPQRPQQEDEQTLAAYAFQLQMLNLELQPLIEAEALRRERSLEAQADVDFEHATAAAVPQSLAARLLRRVAHLPQIPASISDLAARLAQALPGAQADLLATELRLQIQTALEADLQRQLQEANALIIGQTLQDLGYQVEDIAETLFVDGGTVHFRQSSWGNYMVRMRIDPKTSSANFNVIRAVSEADNERSVLDHLAEDRWCSEFPALLKALEARGLHLQDTRRLEAGELPVQLVAAHKLPVFTDASPVLHHRQLKTRQLP